MQDRGTHFAVGNGVLLGSLLELLVVRGGPEGMLQAVSIVDGCHTQGVFWGIQDWDVGVHCTTQALLMDTGGPCVAALELNAFRVLLLLGEIQAVRHRPCLGA